MRFVENKEKTEHQWTFDSWFEFVEFGKNRVKAPSSYESSRRKEGAYDKWFCTENFEQAVELAENGWSDGRQQIKVLSDVLLNKVTQLIQREEIRFDVTGNDFDVSLVNQGVPECWMRFENTEIQSGTGHKVIKMAYNCAVSAGIDTEVITARGAACCALIEALEYAGFRVELTLWQCVSGYKVGVWTTNVLLKAADQQLDIDKLAFSIMHPSTLRRFMFALEESNEQFCKEIGSGYGSPKCIRTEQQGDIYFSSAMLGATQWTSPKEATDWILSELRKQGVVLSEEVPA